MIDFVTEHKEHRVPDADGQLGLRWGLEPLCAVLSGHGVSISPSTYYESVHCRPCRREFRDEQVTALLAAERDRSRLVAGLGSRKMWLHLTSIAFTSRLVEAALAPSMMRATPGEVAPTAMPCPDCGHRALSWPRPLRGTNRYLQAIDEM
ncbi:hypothetical protein [Intrasporangium calvum]|uniref:hypothetical protein n=1 Tax=Intrasporangium calvum TaxID=53358 RepID=UPI003B588C96